MALSNLECSICKQSLLIGQLCNCTQNQDQSPELTASGAFNSSLETRRHHQNQYIDPSRLLPVCTPCGHIFHKACIAEWFRVRRHFDGGDSVRCTCPSCRKPIAYHKLIRIYLPTVSSNTSILGSVNCPTRISVTEAVRRYNEQHLLANGVTMDRQRARNRSNIYRDFFILCNSISDEWQQNNFQDLPATQPYNRLRNRQNRQPQDHEPLLQVNGLESVEYSCHNEDCVALQNVYQILSMEFKSQQRKLEQEIDISKMKSLLITELQRDIEKLRKINANSPSKGKMVWIALVSYMVFWICALICAIFV